MNKYKQLLFDIYGVFMITHGESLTKINPVRASHDKERYKMMASPVKLQCSLKGTWHCPLPLNCPIYATWHSSYNWKYACLVHTKRLYIFAKLVSGNSWHSRQSSQKMLMTCTLSGKKFKVTQGRSFVVFAPWPIWGIIYIWHKYNHWCGEVLCTIPKS